MEHSSCIDNKYFYIWFEDKCSFVEDLELKLAIPLIFSPCLVFEHSLVELKNCVVFSEFFKQEE